MEKINFTAMIDSVVECSHCEGTVQIDVEEIELYLGQCPHCGEDIYMGQDADYEWGSSQ